MSYAIEFETIKILGSNLQSH